ncbi:hypothetical protein Efla_002580 [Eimeria flavescens]
MASPTVQALLLALFFLLVPLQEQTSSREALFSACFAEAASGRRGGSGSSSGSSNNNGSNDGEEEPGREGDDQKGRKGEKKDSPADGEKSRPKSSGSSSGSSGSGKKPDTPSTGKPKDSFFSKSAGGSTSGSPGGQNAAAQSAIPMLWNAASKTAATASEEALDLEEFNAALNRIFERRMSFHPRFHGALEDINEAISRDLLANSPKMAPTERQKILYSIGGQGTYMEVPKLLHELRQEADHPVEEQARIKRLHRLRRRGIPISVDQLKMRPFVRRAFEGPVTATNLEETLTEGDSQQRQAALNGWLQMQDRARQLHRQHWRHRRSAPVSEPINDDDFEVDDEDVEGLSFEGKLSEEEGGQFLKEYKEYLAKMDEGQLVKPGERGEADDEYGQEEGEEEEDEE